jgi:hypothetical protein
MKKVVQTEEFALFVTIITIFLMEFVSNIETFVKLMLYQEELVNSVNMDIE